MNKLHHKLFFLTCISLLTVINTVSCSKTDKNALFQQKLSSVDAVIEEGREQKALNTLQALRKKAESPLHYLSIAKRELQLHAPVQAVQSIQAGLKKHPGDAMLNAAMVSTLLQENRADDAVSAAANLIDTAYAGLGAEAFIQADKVNGTHQTPISVWEQGYKLTGEHTFLENAAVLLAYKGDVAAAAALRSSISKEEALHNPYFWSCLAYDVGSFKPVLDDLVYTLAYADMAGLPEHNPKAFEYARRHILLAADASAGLGELEQARGFWQSYIDRYPDSANDVFYNLAMTAPTEQEKAEILIECMTHDPGYYPAVAQYVRSYAALRAATVQNDTLTEYLQNKDFFSLEMEKALFVSSAFTLSAEEVLDHAIAMNKEDLRFLLENFRYRYMLPKNYAQGSGEMWKLLEDHQHNPLINAYARWYFAVSNDFNACFSIEKTENKAENAFYDGIRSAVQGYSTASLKHFADAAQDTRYESAAVLNQAYIYDARNEPDKAVTCFSRAASLTSDKKLKRKILYETAKIYVKRNGISEAIDMLNTALELDSENHRAEVLKQRLTVDGSINHSTGTTSFAPSGYKS